MIRKHLRDLLLWILNSRLLNSSPCRYGFIGNVDAFDYQHLQYEAKARPNLTVRELLHEADIFRSCPVGKSLQVIEGGTVRDATPGDLADLRSSLRPSDPD